jgi:2-(3-amino-3-carboxypropyl)histidine synthase
MNVDEIAREIKKTGSNRVFVQIPEGLKKTATRLVSEIEKSGSSAFLSAEPCYGACDLRTKEAEILGCDLIVHIGHSEFYRKIKTKIPVLYFPVEIDADIKKTDFSRIPEKKIGVITTIQHMEMMKDIKKMLRDSGKNPVVAGQVLGCWNENAKKIEKDVDAFLFVGSGEFHPTGLRAKNIYVLDLEKHEIRKIDRTGLEKIRYANIFRAKSAKSFGILVSTKPGQFDIKNAENAKKLLERKGKKAFILIMDNINSQILEGIDVDAFINTACPRIAEDKFAKPIINHTDLEEVFM